MLVHNNTHYNLDHRFNVDLEKIYQGMLHDLHQAAQDIFNKLKGPRGVKQTFGDVDFTIMCKLYGPMCVVHIQHHSASWCARLEFGADAPFYRFRTIVREGSKKLLTPVKWDEVDAWSKNIPCFWDCVISQDGKSWYAPYYNIDLRWPLLVTLRDALIELNEG